jgi:hypothetical protein
MQSWLLHPSQLISHSAALLQEFETQLPAALKRLRAYHQSHGQAVATGADFDDRATARQWTLLVARAVDSGLWSEADVLEYLPAAWREI